MKVHFIAIGGSAMHSLAIALYKKGNIVSGSDDVIYDPSKSNLEKYGLLPDSYGWFPQNIDSSIDYIILGMHAKEDNPELLRAQELGLKVYSYPEFLYECSKEKTRVVIGGSHGKTTITSMVLHVMDYHDKGVDYMLGAQLDGFDTMVRLTDENDFMLLEGDEYLSSAIDRRPKFHLYRPNIALLSGISWDHINVFPTFDIYKEQFKVFIESMTNGGMLVYNQEDRDLVDVVDSVENPIKKYPYTTPDYHIDCDQTYLITDEGDLPLEFFGKHNLQNLAGAKWVCQHMGIDQDDFYEAIASFNGASKRLEKVIDNGSTVVFKDFAHSPSKVKATVKAVKEQYTQKTILACLELHTYSSLNSVFLDQYKGALDGIQESVVFYDKSALEIKGLESLSVDSIKESFGSQKLVVFDNVGDFREYLDGQDLNEKVLVFMSSGNYGGVNFDELLG